jgi:hypothetical protein
VLRRTAARRRSLLLLLRLGLRVRKADRLEQRGDAVDAPCRLLLSGARFDRVDAELAAIRGELEAVNAKSSGTNGLAAPMFARILALILCTFLPG